MNLFERSNLSKIKLIQKYELNKHACGTITNFDELISNYRKPTVTKLRNNSVFFYDYCLTYAEKAAQKKKKMLVVCYSYVYNNH